MEVRSPSEIVGSRDLREEQSNRVGHYNERNVRRDKRLE
jgi:hypothetical protein